MKKSGKIEVIDLPSKKSFVDFYSSKSKPVIIRNSMENWQALKLWTPTYFRDAFGQVEVFVLMNETLTGDDEGKVATVYKKIRLSTFIDNVLTIPSTAGYLEQYPIFKQIPSLNQHVHFPKLYWLKMFTWPGLFIGPKSTKSKLHCDQLDNFFFQIYGSKRIILIPKQYYDSCYPTNSAWDDSFSPIDIENPDYTKFPKFKDVEYFEVTLQPGEMIYIPRGWWHDVRSLEISINVNIWWSSPQSIIINGHHILRETLLGEWYPFKIDKSMIYTG